MFADTGVVYDISIITSTLQSWYLIAKHKCVGIRMGIIDRLVLEPFLETFVLDLDTLEAIKTSHIYHFKVSLVFVSNVNHQ